MKKLFYFLCLVAGVAACLTSAAGHCTFALVFLKLMMFVLMATSLYFGLQVEPRLFSPFTLFSTYPCAILFYSDYISEKYLPLPSWEGALVLILAGYSVFFGMLTMSGIGASRIRKLQKMQDLHGISEMPETDYSTWTMFLLFLIPIVMVLINVDIDSLDFSSKEDIQTIRSQSGIAIFGSLSMFYVVVILNAVRKRQKLTLIAVFVLIFFVSLLQMSKGALLNAMLAFFFGLELYRRDILKNTHFGKTLLGITGALIVMSALFSFYGALRSGSLGEEEYMAGYDYARRYHDIAELPKPLQSLYNPYMYFTTPTSNVLFLVENQLNHGDGTIILWPIITTFQLKRLFDIGMSAMPIRIEPYNTFSLGGAFYYEGGWPMVILGCFILGFLTYWFYYRACCSRDIIIYVEYFFWGLALFYGFFSNHFLTQAYPLRALIIFEVYRLLCRTPKHLISSPSVEENSTLR